METIDLSMYCNKIPSVWNDVFNKEKTHIAFGLKDRVPLGALYFNWLINEQRMSFNSNQVLYLSKPADRYPIGINCNFAFNEPIFPYRFLSELERKKQDKINACLSYVTMPFLHKYGILNIENNFETKNYGIHAENNKLLAFVEIPYDVYITALHVFGVSSSIESKSSLTAHPYITEHDVSKLEVPIENVCIVKEKDIKLPFGFFGGILHKHDIETIEVDDIYEYLTGTKIEQQPFKLFEYEYV